MCYPKILDEIENSLHELQQKINEDDTYRQVKLRKRIIKISNRLNEIMQELSDLDE